MGSQGVVFEGKTLDDAVRKGLEALGLSRAEVMITMIEEGSGGFLGIGARPYKVRVMPRPGGAIREPGEDRGGRDRGRGGRAARGERETRERGGRERGSRDRGRRDRGGHEAGRSPGGGERVASPAGREARSGRDGRRAHPRGESRPEGLRMPQAIEPRAAEEREERVQGAEGRRRRRRGGRGRGGRDLEQGAAPPRSEPGGPRGAAEATGEPAVATGGSAPWPPEQLATEARQLTEGVLTAMGFKATVTATAEGQRADVSISVPEHEDLLTGPKGEVRQALQHLLGLMINREHGARYHIQLEINDFWKKREDDLQRLARELAEEAIATGGEAVTEYLNSQERRVVHMTLKEDGRVKTYALGTGLIKRVAVAPADFAGGPREEE